MCLQTRTGRRGCSCWNTNASNCWPMNTPRGWVRWLRARPVVRAHAERRCSRCSMPHMPCATCWSTTTSARRWRWRRSCRPPCNKRPGGGAARAESQRAFAQSRRSGRRPGRQGVSLASKSCGCWRISRLRRSTSLRKARRSCAAAQRRFSSDVSACMGVTETGRPSSSTATMVK